MTADPGTYDVDPQTHAVTPHTVPGVRVETAVAIEDPVALGIAIAGLASDDQARFLVGVSRGFGEFYAAYQIRYVTEAIKGFPEGDQWAVRAFVQTLADHISEVKP